MLRGEEGKVKRGGGKTDDYNWGLKDYIALRRILLFLLSTYLHLNVFQTYYTFCLEVRKCL